MGKPELGGRERAERVVLGVVDRRPLELELGVARGDVAPAPADHRPADVEPGVGTAVEAAGQRDRHPADPAADVEHPVGGLEAGELREEIEELPTGGEEVPLADEREAAGRHEVAATAPQPAEQVGWHEEDPAGERLREVDDLRLHAYSNGSSAATSARRGADLSRSESSGSPTPHSTPTSGSSQAMPDSVAGS